MTDSIRFELKPEDAPEMPLTLAETVQPRRVRSQLAEIEALLLTLQDDVYAAVGSVPMGASRDVLRAIYGGLDDAYQRVQRVRNAVERGG